MLSGSCCCGEVRVELDRAPSMLATCHCSRCRKVGASSFLFVERDALRIVSGRDHIRTYRPDAPYKYARSFCALCGTALGEIFSDEESLPIPANLIDGDPGVRNRFHEFVAEKPDWYEISDGAKQFDGHPQRAG